MNTKALIVAAGITIIIFVVYSLFHKWAINRLSDRVVKKVLSGETEETKLHPESDFIINLTDDTVNCSRPDGKTESVKWNDLQKVELLTTDDGPFAPDAFWVLHGTTGGCVIPWGATGEKELLPRLQALPGFNNEAILSAASLTTKNLIKCWERN